MTFLLARLAVLSQFEIFTERHFSSGIVRLRASKRKRRYLGRYFAHPMMQNRRAKRDDYKPSAALKWRYGS
ncbi:hypothetical protein [Piscirickettsia salmonis]|uniref:hypothetical protein n=1 Tax=Piscirickettsia salmonis TaxID=1238 RepID=UPI000D1C85FE